MSLPNPTGKLHADGLNKGLKADEGGFTQAWDTVGAGAKDSHAGESLTKGSVWLRDEVK